MARDQWGNRIRRKDQPLIDATSAMGPRGPMPYPPGSFPPMPGVAGVQGMPHQGMPPMPPSVPQIGLMPIGNLSGVPTPNYGAAIPPFQHPEAMDFQTFMTLDPRVQDQVYAQMSPEKRQQFAQQGVQAIAPKPSPKEAENQVRELLIKDGMNPASAAHYAAGGNEWNDPQLAVPAGSEITPGGSIHRPHDFPSGNVNPAFGHPNANPAHEVEHAKDQLEKVEGAMGGDPGFHTNPLTGEIIRIPDEFRKDPNAPDKIKERADNVQAWHEGQDSGQQDLDPEGNPYNDGKVISKNEGTAYVNDPGAAHHQASFNPRTYRYNRDTGRVEKIPTQWETPGTKADREEGQEAADVGVVEVGPLENFDPSVDHGPVPPGANKPEERREGFQGDPTRDPIEKVSPEGEFEESPEGIPFVPGTGELNTAPWDPEEAEEFLQGMEEDTRDHLLETGQIKPGILDEASDPEYWGFGSDFNMVEEAQNAGEDPSLLGLDTYEPYDGPEFVETTRDPWSKMRPWSDPTQFGLKRYDDLEDPRDFRGNAEQDYERELATLKENLRRSKKGKDPVDIRTARSPEQWEKAIAKHQQNKKRYIDRAEGHRKQQYFEKEGIFGDGSGAEQIYGSGAPINPVYLDTYPNFAPAKSHPYAGPSTPATFDPLMQYFLKMGPLLQGMGNQAPPIQPPMRPPNPMALDPALSLPPNALNNMGR